MSSDVTGKRRFWCHPVRFVGCGAFRTKPWESPVSTHKPEQRHLFVRGRDFHFVTYDGQPANERRGEDAVPPMWFLMGPAKRWPVMPHVVGQSDEDVEKAMMNWLTSQGLGRLPKNAKTG